MKRPRPLNRYSAIFLALTLSVGLWACGGGASSSGQGSEAISGEGLSPLVSAGGEVGTGGGGGMVTGATVCNYNNNEHPRELKLTIAANGAFGVLGSGKNKHSPMEVYVGDYDGSQSNLEPATRLGMTVTNDSRDDLALVDVNQLVIQFYFLSDLETAAPGTPAVLELSTAADLVVTSGDLPPEGVLAQFGDPYAYFDLTGGTGGILVAQICGVQVLQNGDISQVMSNPVFFETLPGTGPS